MGKHVNGWQDFLKLCIATKDEKGLSDLFDFLLTPEERNSLSTRCLIIKALLEDIQTQREIAKDLGVSIAKITRGSNELKRISNKLRLYLKLQLTAR